MKGVVSDEFVKWLNLFCRGHDIRGRSIILHKLKIVQQKYYEMHISPNEDDS